MHEIIKKKEYDLLGSSIGETTSDNTVTVKRMHADKRNSLTTFTMQEHCIHESVEDRRTLMEDWKSCGMNNNILTNI